MLEARRCYDRFLSAKIKDKRYVFHERLSLDIHCLTNYIKNIKKQKHK